MNLLAGGRPGRAAATFLGLSGMAGRGDGSLLVLREANGKRIVMNKA